ncbi:glycine-rich cell wall structural protein-like [Contarinia nasturtii]|uniref:glycine-rich cell wall structural protein-like n=1 Tax=Contarinia nasturtii TaxID=265458 RepID=UPI0012D391F1|nr:glycine-rich cell wall structural protein-like [Contarinia nasturtii]
MLECFDFLFSMVSGLFGGGQYTETNTHGFEYQFGGGGYPNGYPPFGGKPPAVGRPGLCYGGFGGIGAYGGGGGYYGYNYGIGPYYGVPYGR